MPAPKRVRVDKRSGKGRMDRTGLAALGVAVLAVACCAAAPALLAVVGGVALGSVLGWTVGAVALGPVVAALVVVGRRRQRSAVSNAARR